MTSTPEPERRTLAGLTAMDTSAFENLPKNDYPDNITIKYTPFIRKGNVDLLLVILAGTSIFATVCMLILLALEQKLGMYLFTGFFYILAWGVVVNLVIILPLLINEHFRSFTINKNEITHQWLWRKRRFTITPDTIMVLYNPAGYGQRRLFLLDTRTRKHVRFYFGGTAQGDRFLSEIMQHLRRLDLPYETRPLNVDSINGPQQEKYLSAYSPWEIWASENFFTLIFLIIPVGFIAFMVTLVLIISHFQN